MTLARGEQRSELSLDGHVSTLTSMHLIGHSHRYISFPLLPTLPDHPHINQAVGSFALFKISLVSLSQLSTLTYKQAHLHLPRLSSR
jgi:hypothetical protein